MTDLATESDRKADLRAPADLDPRLEEHRGELTGYCYRMLGSAFDADDAVQDTMVRAWRGLDRFEGRSALRSWLYRIATNVCLDLLASRQRRARPMDLSSSSWQPVEASLHATQPEVTWVEPILDGQVLRSTGDPAELAVERESIRLAFVAALQHLPPRQRAVLILRDVLRWKADEVAELLESSVASVNSALQRARATLGSERVREAPTTAPLNDDDEALLARYVEAFESYDIDGFVALLHEDATQNMPPYEMWLRGRADIGAWMLGPGHGCRGSRLIPTRANGRPAFAHYRASGPGGRHEPFALVVLELAHGQVVAITSFLDTNLFPLLGLPSRWTASAESMSSGGPAGLPRMRSDSTRMSAHVDGYGHRTLRFERTYGYDVEEVWSALTGDVDPVPDESVVEAEAPYLLVCTAGDDVVRWELESEGGAAGSCSPISSATTSRLVPGAARCHSALEQIADTLDGRPPTVTFDDLVLHYSTLVPSAA